MKLLYKYAILKNLAIIIGKHLKAGNFITKGFQHRCFPVNITKFLKTPVLKDIWEPLLLNFIDSRWKM